MPSRHNNIEILTKDDVLKVAQKFVNDNNVEVVNFSLNPYSEEKLGHMGIHLQLVVNIKRTDTNTQLEPCKFFVKAILNNSKSEVDFMKEYGIFKQEYAFFHVVKPLLTENYKDDAWSPTCYLADEQFLVMDDLRNSNLAMITNFLDKTSLIKSGLETLARFHACSIVAEARLSHLQKKSVALIDYFPENLIKEKFFFDKNLTNSVIKSLMNLVYELAESLGRSSQNIRKTFDKLYDIVKPSKKFRNVIVHSDLWANNMMFKEPETETKCVLVDFQTIRYGPNMLDISQFFYLNTTPNYRQQYEQDLLKYYLMVLEKTIKNNDETKTAIAPTFEETLEAYECSRLFGASLASMYLPFILLDQKKMEQMYNDPDGFTKALYSDRTDVTIAYMKQNESYKNRIEEVIHELSDIADH